MPSLTVKKLIEELQKLPPERGVFLSIDEEGNGYRPLMEAQESYMDEENEPIHPDDLKDWKDENDGEEPGKAVILWP